MDLTSRLSLKKPTLTGSGDLGVTQLRTAISDNADALDDAVLYLEGTLSARPTAGFAGRIYYATDTGDYWRDTGSTWRFDRATANATIGAGSTTAMSAGATRELQMGALSGANVAGVFSRITAGTGHAIQVAFAGRYRVTSTLSISGGTGGGVFEVGPLLLGAPTSNGPIGTLAPDVGVGILPSSRIVTLAANDVVDARAKQTGGSGYSATLLEMTIERVGP